MLLFRVKFCGESCPPTETFWTPFLLPTNSIRALKGMCESNERTISNLPAMRLSLLSTVNFFISFSWTLEVQLCADSDSNETRSVIDTGLDVELLELDSLSGTRRCQRFSLSCSNDTLQHNASNTLIQQNTTDKSLTVAKTSTMKSKLTGHQHFVC